MTNPFEDENGTFFVLVNEQGQYSLWPSFIDIPEGWQTVGPERPRSECLEWIEHNWTDMRPRNLIRQMDEDSRKHGYGEDL